MLTMIERDFGYIYTEVGYAEGLPITTVMCKSQIHPPGLKEPPFQATVQLPDFTLEMQYINTAQNWVTFLHMQMQLGSDTASQSCFPRD